MSNYVWFNETFVKSVRDECMGEKQVMKTFKNLKNDLFVIVSIKIFSMIWQSIVICVVCLENSYLCFWNLFIGDDD